MDKENLTETLAQNVFSVQKRFGNSFDLKVRPARVFERDAFFLFLDGMVSEIKAAETVIIPLTNAVLPKKSENPMQAVILAGYMGTDMVTGNTLGEVCDRLIAGCIVLLLDNCKTAFAFGVQGYAKKGIEEPQSEQNERGSQESFTDSFKDNITLLRRKLKTPDLVIKNMTIGKMSRTPTLICYINGRVSEDILKKVTKRLENTSLDTLLGSSYLRPFLDGKKPSLFSDTGFTERPDMLAAKLTEGRVGVIVDGTPFALIVPYLFEDYFHSPDDYLFRPYYALFIRLLRFLCFFTAVALPGFFVAVCVFHPEVLPGRVIADIAEAEANTPFGVTLETLTIHLIYEIVREAGLRMPRAVGHAVSIVGALVIGDTAVTAGLIGAPMLIIVALTAICSSVVSKLHETVAVLRFMFILLGGFLGLFGVFLGLGLLLADICGVSPYGIPFSAPFSPFFLKQQADAVFRAGFHKLGKLNQNVKGMRS